jgi:hypothetical protein
MAKKHFFSVFASATLQLHHLIEWQIFSENCFTASLLHCFTASLLLQLPSSRPSVNPFFSAGTASPVVDLKSI